MIILIVIISLFSLKIKIHYCIKNMILDVYRKYESIKFFFVNLACNLRDNGIVHSFAV